MDEQQRDQLAQQLLSEQGIIWSAFDDKCVLPPGSVRTKQGEFFKVFTPFKRAWLTLFQPPVIGKNRPVALWNVPSALAELVWHPEQAFDYPRIDSTPWAADFETVRAQLRDFCRERVQDYHQARDFPARKAPVRSHPTWRLVCYRRVNAWLACITSHQWANSVKGHKSG